jgi:hypothetical protein
MKECLIDVTFYGLDEISKQWQYKQVVCLAFSAICHAFVICLIRINVLGVHGALFQPIDQEGCGMHVGDEKGI